MFLLLLIASSLCSSSSIECHQCVDSPLAPAETICNRTCTGRFCYRAEKNISDDMRIADDERAIIMDCLEYPFEQLNLGCRCNFEGVVLCICQNEDFCNGAEPMAVVDLPLSRDCFDGDLFDDESYNAQESEQCSSNFCTRNRVTPTDSFFGAAKVKYKCRCLQRYQFDIFVGSFPLFLPAGICASFQFGKEQINEFCSCQQGNLDCSTPSRFPYDSGLPLDGRKSGFIRCAMRDMQGVKECLGHVCAIVRLEFNELEAKSAAVYGCITYDERFVNRRMLTGTYRLPDGRHMFLCDKEMCNQWEDGEVFPGLPFLTNDTCNCLALHGTFPSAPDAAAPTSPNLHLILGISIPALICLLFSAGVIVFRVAKGEWPLYECARVRQRNTLTRVVQLRVVSNNK